MLPTHQSFPLGLAAGVTAAAFILVVPVPAAPDDAGMVWSPPLEIAAGQAYRGPWLMNDSDFRYVDDASVSLAKDGSAAVVWVDQAEQDVFFQRYDADGRPLMNEPANVSGSPDIFSWLPRVKMPDDDTDEIYVLWQEIAFTGGSHGGDIHFARSEDGGNSFSEPNNLSRTPSGAGKGRLSGRAWHNGSLDLSISPDGMIYAAWTDYEGPLWVSRSEDQGRSFSNPVHVAGDDTAPSRGPALATGTDGTVHLAWSVGEDDTGNIHYVWSDDKALTFSEPVVVWDTPGHSDAPTLAVDGAGTVHVAYGESEDGRFGRYRLAYTRMEAGSSAFDQPVDLAASLAEEYDSMSFPALAIDGSDRIYLIWELFDDHTRLPQGLGFVASRDGGETFGSATKVPDIADPARGYNGSLQGLLGRKISVDPSGEVAVVNSTFDPGQSSHIWLIRGRTAAW